MGRAGDGRKNPPHTSPLRDLPAHVRVTRAHHALAGKVLEVFGQLTRRGQRHLILVLPDGTRSYVPAAWTDLDCPGAPVNSGEVSGVARVPDLLHARQRVDALLRRIGIGADDVTTLNQEIQRAAKPNGIMVRGASSDTAHLLSTHSSATVTPHLSSGVSDAQAGSSSSNSATAANAAQAL